VLHLASAPQADMNERELFGCVDWIAHGFEIVSSPLPSSGRDTRPGREPYGTLSGEPIAWR
jgi:hypothetical protein